MSKTCVVCGKPTINRRKTCSEECLKKLRYRNVYKRSETYFDIFDDCVKHHPSMSFKLIDIFNTNKAKFDEIHLTRTPFLRYFTKYIIARQFERANITTQRRQYYVPDEWR